MPHGRCSATGSRGGVPPLPAAGEGAITGDPGGADSRWFAVCVGQLGPARSTAPVWSCGRSQQAGISLPHSSQALRLGGQRESRDALQPGDVVNYYSDASHIGI